jgi:hypothetical protein
VTESDRVAPKDLPEAARARVAAMLSPVDAQLFTTGMMPNLATVVMRRVSFPFPRPDVPDEEAECVHVDLVANGMVVRAEFWSKGSELIKESVTAISVDSVTLVKIDDGNGTVRYTEVDGEVEFFVDGDVAAAVVRARGRE